MKRRIVFYICTLILVCMFFRTVPAAAKENIGDINIENMSEALPEKQEIPKQVRSTIIASGECGENATWKLDSAGTLICIFWCFKSCIKKRSYDNWRVGILRKQSAR